MVPTVARCCDPVKALHCRLLSCSQPQSLGLMVGPKQPLVGKSTCDAVIRVQLPLSASVTRAYCYTLIGHTALFLSLSFYLTFLWNFVIAVLPSLACLSARLCPRRPAFLCDCPCSCVERRMYSVLACHLLSKQLYEKINSAFWYFAKPPECTLHFLKRRIVLHLCCTEKEEQYTYLYINIYNIWMVHKGMYIQPHWSPFGLI